jgi:peptidoglycan/xylan/chitin deacetylase (PgdA/CDA1 family)
MRVGVSPSGRALLASVGLALHRLARLGAAASRVRILYYHSISDAPVRSSVSPGSFESQLEYLVRDGYTLLSLSQAIDRLASETAFGERNAVVTLDDGFQDNYEHALPILSRLRVPATVFLTVGYIGTDRLPTLTRTDFMPRPLDWREVKEMQAQGIEFGSHTITHPMLSQVPLDVARREIGESKRMLEDRLGTAVPFFCYPRGDVNEAVRRIVCDEGYRAACSTLPGLNDRRTDLFGLRRTYISRRDSPPEFAKKMAGAYDLLQQALLVWRRLRPR